MGIRRAAREITSIPGRAAGWLTTCAALAIVGCGGSGDEQHGGVPTFVGAPRCATCHPAESSAWRSSQHAVAMQPARPAAVLGRFDGARLTSDGLTTTFLRRDDRYVVNTEGADSLADFDVAYTFGVYPLQQYIVSLGGGRFQPLPYAWDARPDSLGGQRWFSLDPSPRPQRNDFTHWAGRYANWNHMCADCHSTGVRKGYDAAADTFHTTWAAIDVSCEACHGPASRHVSWAERPRFLRFLWRDDAPLPAHLDERRGIRWITDSSGRTIARSAPRTTDREIEVCAQCHARRVHVADGYTAGAPFYDFYDPDLITPGLYFPDGQQREEIYTYGSFLQSRMYAAGVTCSDCHDPHTGKPRRAGNALCTQCHAAARYDTTAHHFHLTASTGASCVGCHMPDTTYMAIDRRHDHGMRVPRPDLSVQLGTPNACTRCHQGRDASWAAERVRAWYGHDGSGFQHFAGAFAADDAAASGAADSLLAVARDPAQPMIVRASALARLAAHPGPAAFDAASRAAADPHPLVRRAALEILGGFAPRDRIAIAAPRLADSSRIVRLRAAWMLAAVGDSLGTPELRRAFSRAAGEYVESQRYNGDRVTSRLSLGAFYAARGLLDSAETESRAAVRLGPTVAQGYLNLAGVLLAKGQLVEAERVLADGIARIPGDAELSTVHAAVADSLRKVGR